MREVGQLAGQGVVDGSAADDEVAYLAQALTTCRVVQQVVNL